MSRFPTPGHLLSWAGLCPRLHESAGKRLSTRTRPGASWLKTTLVQAAWAAVRRPGYLQAQFLRLKSRRGPKKAILAVAASETPHACTAPMHPVPAPAPALTPAVPPRHNAAVAGDDDDPFPDPVVVPIEDALDLHPFAPRDVPSVVVDYVEAAAAAGLAEVRVIHGRGKGVQRRRVREVLLAHPLVVELREATPERGGAGATIVRLRAVPH